VAAGSLCVVPLYTVIQYTATTVLYVDIHCAMDTDSEDYEGASGRLPQAWDTMLKPLALAALYSYKVYNRANVCGDTYVTSGSYKRQQTRDNSWICFQHHVHGCASASVISCWCDCLMLPFYFDCMPTCASKQLQAKKRNYDMCGGSGILYQGYVA
jgi:hypothetical protein